MKIRGLETREVEIKVRPNAVAWELFASWLRKVAPIEYAQAQGALQIHQGMWSWEEFKQKVDGYDIDRKYGREVDSHDEETYHAFKCIIKASNELQ